MTFLTNFKDWFSPKLFLLFLPESEKRVDEQTSVSLENGIWPSAVQPNSPLNDEAPVAAEDVNSQQAPGIKKENQSIGSGEKKSVVHHFSVQKQW